MNSIARASQYAGMIARLQASLSSGGWTLFPLRVLIGFGFAAHGYAKLSRGPESFAVILAALGVPHPLFMAWFTALVELFGGVAMIVGVCVFALTLPLTVVMLTAMFSVHLQYGFSSVRLRAVTASGAEFGPIGIEMNLLYIVGLLTLALGGSGRLSIDGWLSARKQRTKARSQFAKAGI